MDFLNSATDRPVKMPTKAEWRISYDAERKRRASSLLLALLLMFVFGDGGGPLSPPSLWSLHVV
jgi:hypothetical protein